MNIYETMADLKSLPVPKTGCRAHYEGSIDKKGGIISMDNIKIFRKKERNAL